MVLTAKQLEQKIKSLNDWLLDNKQGIALDYAKNEQARNYYVNKLIELSESGFKTINV